MNDVTKKAAETVKPANIAGTLTPGPGARRGAATVVAPA